MALRGSVSGSARAARAPAVVRVTHLPLPEWGAAVHWWVRAGALPPFFTMS